MGEVYTASGTSGRVDGDALILSCHAPLASLSREAGFPIALFAVNYGRYVLQLVATYGCNVLGEVKRKVRTSGAVIEFRRNAVIDDYYAARHAVDDHNHLRQGQRLDLERAWASKSWAIRQFAFLISASLVNAYLAYKHFDLGSVTTFNAFRRHVARELMDTWRDRDMEPGLAANRPKRRLSDANRVHTLERLAKFCGATPGKKAQQPYQQVRCRGHNCSKMVRTHCSCQYDMFLCLECYAIHVADAIA